ncbi:MAG: Dipeptidyl aminopeptidase/acylaminoacyl peptidase, partial [Phenylobacterium sp.]|nr:Dipeptidyl aminopeptidase/acylaminoacyl peptidase [Phenylobacterium sp.]
MFRSIVALSALAAAALLASGAAARPLTQKDLVSLDRISDAHVSADGRWAAYDLARLNADGAGRSHSVWVVATDGRGAPVKWAEGSTPRWGPGATLFYLAKGQVWSVCPSCASAAPHQVTSLPLDVDSFRVSPDGERLVVSMAV